MMSLLYQEWKKRHNQNLTTVLLVRSIVYMFHKEAEAGQIAPSLTALFKRKE